jgi:hypothetical protein
MSLLHFDLSSTRFVLCHRQRSLSLGDIEQPGVTASLVEIPPEGTVLSAIEATADSVVAVPEKVVIGFTGGRVRSRSDLSDLVAMRSVPPFPDTKHFDSDRREREKEAEDWTWKWGKMPVKSSSIGSNLNTFRDEILAAPKALGATADHCGMSREVQRWPDIGLILENDASDNSESDVRIAPGKNSDEVRGSQSEYRDNGDVFHPVDVDTGLPNNVSGDRAAAPSSASQHVEHSIIHPHIILDDDSSSVAVTVDSDLQAKAEISHPCSPLMFITNSDGTGDNDNDRAVSHAEGFDGSADRDLLSSERKCSKDDQNLTLDTEIILSEQSEPSERILSLEDIPYDAISPEPAGGDFYDSDTDSYLSLSLEDGDGGDIRRYKYRKILVPSQEDLQQLSLVDGENDVQFELDGCAPVKAQLFVWSSLAKVVVIDIEGAIAITKSSKTIFGLFLEYKTVVHDGVPLLLRNIANNGYKLLYMAQRSTNASELSTSSKVRLAHIHPDLPPGPIFHSPESLVRGFGAHRTDLFKAAALRGLKTLFPPTHNPYSACFCTRPHDTVVFSRYGVVDGRIFLVCENGDITTLNRTFRRTFQELTESLDTMFPPVRGMQ